MFLYAVSGLVLGFIAGMILNAILLRKIPMADYLKNRTLRLRYGTLNWIIALLGMGIGMYLANTNL